MPNYIEAQNLEVGMILGDTLRDITGRTLLKCGVELDETIIARINTWGLEEVPIAGDDLEGESVPTVGYDIFNKPWEEIVDEVNHQFELVSGDAQMRALRRGVLSYMEKMHDLYS